MESVKEIQTFVSYPYLSSNALDKQRRDAMMEAVQNLSRIAQKLHVLKVLLSFALMGSALQTHYNVNKRQFVRVTSQLVVCLEFVYQIHLSVFHNLLLMAQNQQMAIYKANAQKIVLIFVMMEVV